MENPSRRSSDKSSRAVSRFAPDTRTAVRYAEDIAAGRVEACHYVVLAAERFLTDLEDALAGTSDWAFRPDLAARVATFCRQMPNIKGPKSGEALALMPWQLLATASVFGFVERDTAKTDRPVRRFRQMVIFCPRGQGKTSWLAPVGLYTTFCDGEGGAEGYAAAVTKDQARILFDCARAMTRQSLDFRVECGIGVSANTLHQESTSSKFAAISSDSKSLDGLNIHFAACDELASHRTSAVYNLLLTAMGKRTQPLLASISTATANTTGIGREVWNYLVRVLQREIIDDRMFGLIYTIDDGDDAWDENTWKKCNPSWGVAVQPDAFRAIARQARQNTSQESAFRTRHLNTWVGADAQLFSTRAWRECSRPGLTVADCDGWDCDIGMDLSTKVDLAAVMRVFSKVTGGKLHYRIFSQLYIPEAAVLEERYAAYPGWARDGYLTLTEGNEIDFSRIEADILDMCREHPVRSVAFDPWNATMLAQRLTAQGLALVEFRGNTASFTEPTKEIDAAMLSSRIEHDSNPAVEWCVGNVVGHYDARGNVYPRKEKPERKIDAAIGAIMAVGRAMVLSEPSVYEDRGILFLD